MTTYKFRYKRRFFWESLVVVGHILDKELDVMTVYNLNGGLQTIKKWSECELKLGQDWALFVKKDLEKQAGQHIVTNLGG